MQYMFKAREGMRMKVEADPNSDKKTLADKALAG